MSFMLLQSIFQFTSEVFLLIAGAISGGVIGYFIKKREQVEEVKMTQQKLKTALLAEIDSVGQLNQYEDTGVQHMQLFQTNIYESSINDLGFLSEKEVRPIVTYYSVVYIYRESIQLWKESKTPEEEDSSILGPKDQLVFPELFRVVLDQRENALDILEEGLPATRERNDSTEEKETRLESPLTNKTHSKPFEPGSNRNIVGNALLAPMNSTRMPYQAQESKKESPIENRKGRIRPVSAGISISHIDTTGGTLGTPPLRTEDGVIVVLTTTDVAAPKTAQKGDSIIQPGWVDGGSVPEDRIGKLWEWSEIKETEPNTTNSALIKIDEGMFNKGDILDLPDFKGWTDGEWNETYMKSGRTTGLTTSKLVQRDVAVSIQYSQNKSITFTGVDLFEYMAAGGDTGSLIGVSRDDGFYGTHILFANSTEYTCGIPIKAVLAEHGRLKPL